MLYELHLNNIAVIKKADVELSSGFNVMTGQTGAGKSVIIGAIDMLLGNKVDSSVIRTGEDTACVTALFGGLSTSHKALLEGEGFSVDDDGQLLISRSISREARPVVKINGKTATATILKSLVPQLLNIHGQKDTQALLDASKHLDFLDRYADTIEILEKYKEKYSLLCEAKRKLYDIKSEAKDADERNELLKMQLDEIKAARLKDGEEEKLLEQRNKLRSSELIAKQTAFAYRALKGGEKGNILALLEKTHSAVASLSGVLPETEELATRIENCRYELEDVAETVYSLSDIGEGDPTERLNRIEARLDKIEKIKKRFGPEVTDVIKKAQELAEKLDLIENYELVISEAEKKADALYSETVAAGRALSKARKESAEKLDASVAELLGYLDMPKVKFASVFEEIEPTANGIDSMQFCISANPGEPMLPLAKIASGGEASRVMLALKCAIADNDGIQTMVFDEIDTGVSGRTARKMGLLLSELSKKIQILTVTHSAQIASLADTHFSIMKKENDGRSETDVTLLDGNGRIEEIARILGGINLTDLQRDAARQLMMRDTDEFDIPLSL